MKKKVEVLSTLVTRQIVHESTKPENVEIRAAEDAIIEFLTFLEDAEAAEKKQIPPDLTE
ncbi:MAG: hypothetical protein WAU07_00265 [Microgenomates group bacterium]